MTVPVKGVGLGLLFGDNLRARRTDGEIPRAKDTLPGIRIAIAVLFRGQQLRRLAEIRRHFPADTIEFVRDGPDRFGRQRVPFKRPEEGAVWNGPAAADEQSQVRPARDPFEAWRHGDPGIDPALQKFLQGIVVGALDPRHICQAEPLAFQAARQQIRVKGAIDEGNPLAGKAGHGLDIAVHPHENRAIGRARRRSRDVDGA